MPAASPRTLGRQMPVIGDLVERSEHLGGRFPDPDLVTEEPPDHGQDPVDPRRTADIPQAGPLAGASGSLDVCLSQVMNPPSRPAAVRQSLDVRSHQRRYKTSASAYAFVVLSAASWARRRCCKYLSATPTTRYSSSTTVQYRTDEGSLTGNARVPVSPTISKGNDPTGHRHHRAPNPHRSCRAP
jgi:hypothetical protein